MYVVASCAWLRHCVVVACVWLWHVRGSGMSNGMACLHMWHACGTFVVMVYISRSTTIWLRCLWLQNICGCGMVMTARYQKQQYAPAGTGKHALPSSLTASLTLTVFIEIFSPTFTLFSILSTASMYKTSYTLFSIPMFIQVYTRMHTTHLQQTHNFQEIDRSIF